MFLSRATLQMCCYIVRDLLYYIIKKTCTVVLNYLLCELIHITKWSKPTDCSSPLKNRFSSLRTII